MSICDIKKYFAIAIDPIHIGTGGYRIGRVDNTIVREPATDLPKIPGTTIEGAARNYAFLQAKEIGEVIQPGCAKGKTDEGKLPCGKCKICVTFGYTKNNDSFHALAQFSDAQILFFPVATMIGPVWTTCNMVLKDAEIKTENGKIILSDNDKFITNIEKLPERNGKKIINLGWVLLEEDSNKKTKESISANKSTTVEKYEPINPGTWKFFGKDILSALIPQDILTRVVVVHDDIFSQIVNMNLEVRTSVAIDPARGAAEEGALFTYEAIPRSTVFWFDIVFQNPKNFSEVLEKYNISAIEKTVRSGLDLMKYLGIGGMSTRGFGKIDVLNKDSNEKSEEK